MTPDPYTELARELRESLYCDCVRCAGLHDESTCAFEITIASALRRVASEARAAAFEEAAKQLDVTADDYDTACRLLGTGIDHAITRHVNQCVRDELHGQAKAIRARAAGEKERQNGR